MTLKRAMKCCALVCSVQVDQHYHQAAVRDMAHRTLEHRLANMLANYRNPAIPPFDASRLVAAYNACVLAGGLRFVHGRAECALELLSNGRDGILGHLQLAAGFLVTYLQEGDCPTCNTRFQQVNAQEKKIIQAKSVESWRIRVCRGRSKDMVPGATQHWDII